METPQQTRKTRSTMGSPTFLSPSVSSNQEQKEEMVHLNNRMANYVEKVRSLEAENSTLKIQINRYEEKSTTQTNKLKSMYEGELSEARRLLDEQSKDKASLQLDLASTSEKYQASRSEAEEMTLNNAALQQELKNVHSALGTKETQFKALSKEYEEVKNAYDKLAHKAATLQAELETTQKTLESETLLRVDYENKLQSLREDLQFKEKIHAQEISEARSVQSVTISEDVFKAEYDQRLEATIMDLRERHEQDIEMFKEDYEASFNARIDELRSSLELARQANSTQNEEVTGYKVKIDRLEQTVKKLQTDNNMMSNRTQDLEGQLEMQREVRITAVTEITKERDEVRETLQNLEKEYTELADIKVKLDGEIQVYRKLLEEEEDRLKMKPSPRPESASRTRARTQRRKRKRVSATFSSTVTTTSASSETAEETTVKKQRREEVLHEPGPEDKNNCILM